VNSMSLRSGKEIGWDWVLPKAWDKGTVKAAPLLALVESLFENLPELRVG